MRASLAARAQPPTAHSLAGEGARQKGKAPSKITARKKSKKKGKKKSKKESETITASGMSFTHELVWKEWSAGGDWVKRLVVQNASNEVKHMRYALPRTKFFFMDYPADIVLSPGMTFAVPVHFRPVERRVYEDVVQFTVECASQAAPATVLVPVRAVLPVFAASVGAAVELGFCAVGERASGSVEVTNTGDVPAAFAFDAPDGVEVAPTSGVVPPHGSAAVAVTTVPLEAAVFERRVAVRVRPTAAEGGSAADAAAAGDPLDAAVLVRGISKYPHVALDEGEVDFGEVLAGQRAERTVALRNSSAVPATVSLRHNWRGGGQARVFSAEPGRVELPARGQALVRVAYEPITAGAHSADAFEFVSLATAAAEERGVPGPPPSRLRVSGRAGGPRVALGTRAFDFGDVEVGRRVSRTLTLTNASHRAARFEFAAPARGTLTVSPALGTVPALMSATVTLRFEPRDPCNYYHVVRCLVEDQAPLEAECVGTGVPAGAGATRPAELRLHHVRAHEERVARGLALVPPQDLRRRLDADAVLAREVEEAAAAADRQALAEEARAEAQSPASRLMASLPASVRPGEETAEAEPQQQQQQQQTSGAESAYHAIFGADTATAAAEAELEDGGTVDFGACSVLRMAEYRTLRVTNRTAAKMTCVWDAAAVGGDAGTAAADAGAFAVFPPSQDVPARGTATFRVAFRPQRPGHYYAERLQATCFYKTNRSFRLVDTDALVPPVTLTALALGSTFGDDSQQDFLPTASFSRRRVDFCPCAAGTASHQTLVLRNGGDTPLSFRFAAPEAPFRVWPSAGVVEPNGFRLVTLRFEPAAAGEYAAALSCALNGSADASHALSLRLWGAAESARAEHAAEGPGGAVFFQPTCAGMSSSAASVLRNTTRVPMSFEWRVPASMAGKVRVEPARGVLQGTSELRLAWTYTPSAVGALRGRVTCATATVGARPGTPGAAPAVVHADVRGECGAGAVAFDPPALDYGTVQVGDAASRCLVLRNEADCALAYSLEVRAAGGDAAASDLATLALSFDRAEGVLPARSHGQVIVSLRTLAVAAQRLVIVCHVGQGAAVEGAALAEVECPVRAVGWHPQLRVTDLRLERTPAETAWQQCGGDAINADLAAPLSELEWEQCTGGTKLRAMGVADLVRELPAREVHFGVGELNAHPEVLYARVHNPGALPARWDVALPRDDSSELERWADSGEATHEELTQRAIIEHGLFSAEPAAGVLPPGGSATVRLTYHHKFTGVYELPCLLRVHHGKAACLRLRGETVGCLPPRLYLLPHQLWHRLAATPLGLAEGDAPVQTFALPNQTDADLCYSVDMSPVERLCDESSGFPVLRCLNPRGVVRAGGVTLLRWVFRPLEEREYAVEVDIAAWPAVLAEETRTQQAAHRVVLAGTGLPPADPAALMPAASLEAPGAREERGVSTPLVRAPLYQVAARPGQPAILTADAADFGLLACGEREHRTVWIRSLSSDRPVRYRWVSVAGADGGTDDRVCGSRISVEPASGTLRPRESVPLRVTVAGGERAVVVDASFVCRVEYADEGGAPDAAEAEDAAAAAAAAAAVAVSNAPSSMAAPPSLASRPRHPRRRAATPSPPVSPLSSPLPRSAASSDAWDDGAGLRTDSSGSSDAGTAASSSWAAAHDRSMPVSPHRVAAVARRGERQLQPAPRGEQEHAFVNPRGVPCNVEDAADPVPGLERRRCDFLFCRVTAAVCTPATVERMTGRPLPVAEGEVAALEKAAAAASPRPDPTDAQRALAAELLAEVMADPEVLEALATAPPARMEPFGGSGSTDAAADDDDGGEDGDEQPAEPIDPVHMAVLERVVQKLVCELAEES